MHNLYERLKAQREARAARQAHKGSGTRDGARRADAESTEATKTDAKSPNDTSTVIDARISVANCREPRQTVARAALPPPWQELDAHVWQAVLRTPADMRQLVAYSERGGLLVGPEYPLESLGFFDSETTGLSGGAGTTVFLVAVARLYGLSRTRSGQTHSCRGVESASAAAVWPTAAANREHGARSTDAVVETTLLFLSDFAGEPAFLEAVRSQLQQTGTLVSYNGRAFDMNVLRNRFLLNRIAPAEPRHLDLLYPARRLFSALLESCSLSTVERTLLDVRRVRDVDGAEIPDRWLAFLDHRDPTRLEEVFAHVHRDVLSLVELLQYIETVAADPEAGVVDRFQRARLLIESPYRCSSSLSLRRRALHGLAELAYAIDHPLAMRAARYYGALLRRCGNREAARDLWRAFFTQRRSVWAAEELAKDLEHCAGDLEAALAVVQTAAGWNHAAPAAEALERRRRRLESRIARRRSGAHRAR